MLENEKHKQSIYITKAIFGLIKFKRIKTYFNVMQFLLVIFQK
jgi:hypothetical protein